MKREKNRNAFHGSPLWIKLFGIRINLWIMMNGINRSQDWHSVWNCNSFDNASLVAVPLDSKMKTKKY